MLEVHATNSRIEMFSMPGTDANMQQQVLRMKKLRELKALSAIEDSTKNTATEERNASTETGEHVKER